MVEPQSLLLTGLTRDGTFLIEKGKVTRPVNNFRFNDSPAALLKNVVAFSRPERAGESVVPAILARDFHLTSVSEAV
jgi:predicted Zn-dependent protease